MVSPASGSGRPSLPLWTLFCGLIPLCFRFQWIHIHSHICLLLWISGPHYCFVDSYQPGFVFSGFTFTYTFTLLCILCHWGIVAYTTFLVYPSGFIIVSHVYHLCALYNIHMYAITVFHLELQSFFHIGNCISFKKLADDSVIRDSSYNKNIPLGNPPTDNIY